MEKFKNIIRKTPIIPIISILVFFILFFIINKAFCTTDDIVYKNSFDGLATLGPSVQDFFSNWSGRVSIMLLTNFFMNIPIEVFKVVNTLVFLLIIAAIFLIVNIIIDKNNSSVKRKIPYIIIGLIFLISANVLNSGTIWVSGALNYLWPFAFMLISIIPFIANIKDKKIKGVCYIFFILANLISCFSEQSGAILIAFGGLSIIYSIYKKKMPSKLLIAHYIMIIVITLISLSAPGNAARFYSEQIQWYPGYEMLSLGDKLLQGYINTANHLVNNTTLLVLIIASISSFLVIKNKKLKTINKAVSTLPVIYFALKIIPLNIIFSKILPGYDIESTINSLLFTFDKFSLLNFHSNQEMFTIVVSMIMFGTVAGGIIYAFKDKKNGIITAILYAASICASLALSFSPTIFASGNRIFVATDFLLVLVNTLLAVELFNNIKGEKKQFVLLAVLLIVSAIMYINFYTNCLYGIIW